MMMHAPRFASLILPQPHRCAKQNVIINFICVGSYDAGQTPSPRRDRTHCQQEVSFFRCRCLVLNRVHVENKTSYIRQPCREIRL